MSSQYSPLPLLLPLTNPSIPRVHSQILHNPLKTIHIPSPSHHPIQLPTRPCRICMQILARQMVQFKLWCPPPSSPPPSLQQQKGNLPISPSPLVRFCPFPSFCPIPPFHIHPSILPPL